VRARLEDLSTRVPIGGLHDAVAAACERARERGLPVELRGATAPEPAEPEVAAVVLRVLGEALANVERHAQAAHVVVSLEREDGGLALTIEDDGRGLGALDETAGPGGGHFGIALLRERAASIGGRLAVGPGAEGGTRVRLEVPRA
jgi:two-component system, NarL family, sensor histidine kinase UhpB